MLPSCFKPNAQTVTLLARISEGYDVQHEDVKPLMAAGFVELFVGPTPRSGYELTKDGEEALRRAQ